MAIPFVSDIDLKNNKIKNAKVDAPSEAEDIVNKDYVDNKVLDGSILEVSELPTITDDNKNQILRYNNKLYFAFPIISWRNIKVGDNLSGARIKANYPKIDTDVTETLSSYWLDTNTTAQQVIKYIETTGTDIEYWRGGANRTYEYLDAGDTVYEMDGGYCLTNNLTEPYTLSSNFGTVTSIYSTTSKLYTLLYIEAVTSYKWVPIDNEIAIGPDEPTGEEVLWIEDENEAEDVQIEKNIITINLSGDIECSTLGEYTKVHNFSLSSQIGDRLTFNDNYIIIGKGISKVLISGRISWYNTTAGFKYAYIVLNSTGTIWSVMNPTNGHTYNTDSFTNYLVDVKEGDRIYMSYYTTVDGDAIVAQGRTYITVEVIC